MHVNKCTLIDWIVARDQSAVVMYTLVERANLKPEQTGEGTVGCGWKTGLPTAVMVAPDAGERSFSSLKGLISARLQLIAPRAVRTQLDAAWGAAGAADLELWCLCLWVGLGLLFG